jgi:exodeoxyribonuclease-3
MQIATWNVNSIRTRQQQVSDWLLSSQVDVLCLQETKVIDADFPLDFFTKLGYNAYIFGQKAYNGVAIFSKRPLRDVCLGFMPILETDLAQDFDQQKRVMTGVIDNIRIVNVYVPNGSEIGSEKYDYKLRWLQCLKNYLEVLRDKFPEEICLCGDFNVALEDRDIYNPTKGKENHIMASGVERSALKDVLSIGFQDAFRKFTEAGGHFSWWDYRRAGFAQNRGWRIDHHYLTANLYEQAISCRIDSEPRAKEQPSDHTPVIVTF